MRDVEGENNNFVRQHLAIGKLGKQGQVLFCPFTEDEFDFIINYDIKRGQEQGHLFHYQKIKMF